MTDSSAALNRPARQRLIEKLETVVLAVCRLQRHPPLDRPIQAAIVQAELVRLAAAGRADGHELDQDTFDRVTSAIRDWQVGDRRER